MTPSMAFAHRYTEKGEIESICLSCFTVARSRDTEEMLQNEQQHPCQGPAILTRAPRLSRVVSESATMRMLQMLRFGALTMAARFSPYPVNRCDNGDSVRYYEPSALCFHVVTRRFLNPCLLPMMRQAAPVQKPSRTRISPPRVSA